jgi:transcriptional regulator with XRE-family HTH domain
VRHDVDVSDHRQAVGEFIADRRAALAMTQEQLASAVGCGVRTIGNAERGARELRPSFRGPLENALGWAPGSLSAAYRRGAPPRLADLRAGGSPGEDPVLIEILESELPARVKADLIRLREAQTSTLRLEIARRSGRRSA